MTALQVRLAEMVEAAYPVGWSLSYAHMGREWDGTAYVGFAHSPERVVRAIAAHAANVTGQPMTVFQDSDGDWSYRPVASLTGGAA